MSPASWFPTTTTGLTFTLMFGERHGIHDERHAIFGSQKSAATMPDDVALRLHFRADIWQNTKTGHGQKIPNYEEGNGRVVEFSRSSIVPANLPEAPESVKAESCGRLRRP